MKIAKVAAGVLALSGLFGPTVLEAQEAAAPASKGQLPEVEVIQKKAPKPAAPKTQVKKKAPAPEPVEITEPVAAPEGPVYAVPAPSGSVAISPLPGSEIPSE
jgi:hypothetical protein